MPLVERPHRRYERDRPRPPCAPARRSRAASAGRGPFSMSYGNPARVPRPGSRCGVLSPHQCTRRRSALASEKDSSLFGNAPALDVARVTRGRPPDHGREVGIAPDELRPQVARQADDVVKHEHLPVAGGAGADADRRDRELRRDLARPARRERTRARSRSSPPRRAPARRRGSGARTRPRGPAP